MQFGITSINIFFRGWWTLFIIIPCLIGLTNENEKTGNIIGLIIGVALLLATRGLVDLGLIIRLIIPVIVIGIGISVIFKDVLGKKISNRIKQLNKEGLEEYYATFASQKIDLDGDEFKGCAASAIFGGIELNIKHANITEDKIINVNAIFGGIDIWVPSNVNVKVRTTPIFGGVSNKVPNIKGENTPTIYISGLCLFGGVEVK